MTPYFTDGLVSIYHGDCREILPHVTADVLVTDPPYGMAYQSGWKESSHIANDNNTDCRNAALAIWGDRPALVFGRWTIDRPADVRELLIWDKGDWPGMGDLSLPWGPSTEEIYVLGNGFVGKRRGQILRDPKRPSGASAYHPNEKPIGLMELLIASCPPGVIVDPFMGSGSTIVAARNLGRGAIGIEIDEAHCKTAVGRLSQSVFKFGNGRMTMRNAAANAERNTKQLLAVRSAHSIRTLIKAHSRSVERAIGTQSTNRTEDGKSCGLRRQSVHLGSISPNLSIGKSSSAISATGAAVASFGGEGTGSTGKTAPGTTSRVIAFRAARGATDTRTTSHRSCGR